MFLSSSFVNNNFTQNMYNPSALNYSGGFGTNIYNTGFNNFSNNLGNYSFVNTATSCCGCPTCGSKGNYSYSSPISIF